MKLSVEVKELEPGSGRGNLNARLVFVGEKWNQLDLCIHGQQLRWHCGACARYFKDREAKHSKRD